MWILFSILLPLSNTTVILYQTFLLSYFWIQSPLSCNSLGFLAIPCNFLQFLAISYNSLGDFLQNIRKNNYFHARDTWTKQAWPFSMHFLFSKILNIFQRFFLWLKWCWGGLKWECVKSCWQHDCRQFENQRISWKRADLEATNCQLLKKI